LALSPKKFVGASLVEVLVVILIITILSVVAISKWFNLKQAAKIEVLNGIAATLRSSAYIAQMKARVKGLQPVATNPGGSTQTAFVVDFPFGSAEVDWRNLRSESRAELGDRLPMLDFIDLSGDGIQSEFNNQYTLIDYDIPGFSVPTNQGCYVIYDSFGNPNCTVTVVTVGC